MHTAVTRRGYQIPRTMLTEKHMSRLTYTPQCHGQQYGPPPLPIKVFLKTKKHLYLPRYYGYQHFGKPTVNKISEGDPTDLTFSGTLHNYQTPVLKKTLEAFNDPKRRGGIWACATGTGKTVMALATIAEVNKKTLIVVHKEFLLQQWIDRINQFLPNARIGILQRNRVEIKDQDIVIAMLQSLSLKDYPNNTFDSFGLVIFDEVHYVCSRRFSQSMNKVQPFLRLGLSATPTRKDGLTPIIINHLGPILFTLDRTILEPSIEFLECPPTNINATLNRAGKTNIPKLISDLVQHKERNTFIVDTILEKYKEGRKIIVFSHRVQHCKDLQQLLLPDCQASLFIGGLKKDAYVEAKKAPVIIATYSMCKDAFDCPTLDTAVLTTPKSDVVQVIGRILRKKNKFEPLVIDFVDRLSVFLGQYYKRRRWYLIKKYKIQYIKEGLKN